MVQLYHIMKEFKILTERIAIILEICKPYPFKLDL